MYSRSRTVAGLLVLSLSLTASVASAAAPTGRSAAQLELRDGTDGVVSRLFDVKPSSARARAGLRTFQADLGGRVRGMWSAATGAPTRLWGFSVPTAHGPDEARKLASATLRRHVELLAPGSGFQDFELTVDHVDAQAGDLRTIGFAQRWRGLAVLGGHVAFTFKNDRLFGVGSNAFPDLDATMPDVVVDATVARDAAVAWVAEESATVQVGDVDGPYVLPYDDHGKLSYAVVLRVRVEAERPVGSFEVYVDASSGQPIARRQRLMFETAHLELAAWERSPSYADRLTYPGDRVSIDIGGAQALGESASDGSFSFDGESASATATLTGTHVQVSNGAGEEATLDFEAEADASVVWSEEPEDRDAQVVAFVHGGIVNAYARTFAPDLSFLDTPVRATVNEHDVCNAFSDGGRVHFFASGSGCENTGRIADVIYHEYGHSIHAHTFLFCDPGQGACIPNDGGALSEGTSDYLATTITGDPGMARGFFYDDSPLRDLDPPVDRVWPNDLVGESHYDGEIIGGTLWDLRQQLIEDLGEEEGIATADRLYHGALYRADDIPSMYPEMLLVDDDDGDLDNGTPHECAINSAFGRHGLRPIEASVQVPGIVPPTQDGAEIVVGFSGLTAECGESLESAYIYWFDALEPTRSGTVPMTVGDDGLGRGRIPTMQSGQALRFDVNIDSSSGTVHFPQNPADLEYQLYVGEVTPIYCTNFETDPFAEGWTHQLIEGAAEAGADDWTWGPPKGNSQNDDPTGAFSGDNVVGQDLSADGKYMAAKHTALISPILDTSGFGAVRLQYRRWLNVEDAYFDQASVLANDFIVWQNANSERGNQSSVHHKDGEWRFQDIDVTSNVGPAGALQVRFELTSDAGLELGGWNLDDLCVVGIRATDCPSGPPCTPEPEPSPVDTSRIDSKATAPEGDGCDCTVRGGTTPASPALLLGLAAAAALITRRRLR